MMRRFLRRLWRWLRGADPVKEPPVWHADPAPGPKRGASAGSSGARTDGGFAPEPGVHEPPEDEEIPPPPEAEDEPFVEIKEPPAPPVRKRIRLRSADGGETAEMFPVRVKVASVLFGMVGQDYLPGRLVAQLRNRDPFEAVEEFLSSLGTSFDELLQDLEARQLLAQGIEALAELDALRIEARLPDDPLYEALAARDVHRIKSLRSRLEILATLVVDARSVKGVFRDFRVDFLGPLHHIMASWADVDVSILDEGRESLDAWLDLHTRYHSARDELLALLADILVHPAALEDEERELARRMGIHSAGVDRDARAGAVSPEEAIRILEGILEDARKCWEDLRRERRKRPKEPPLEGVLAWMAELGLSEDDELTIASVKRAFRRRAMETHPDHGGPSEAFRAVYDAYVRLQRHLEAGGET